MRECAGKRCLHALQVGEFFPHQRELARGKLLHVGAVLARQAQQVGDVVQRESKLLGAPHEKQALQVAVVISPRSAIGPPWQRQQPDALVVADRFDANARAAGQLSNAHGSLRNHVR
jgi:hypothetical protein